MFVGDGRVVHSHRVFPLKGDSGIGLYAHEGAATIRDLTIQEIKATH
jgi:levanbiose-producing levanase